MSTFEQASAAIDKLTRTALQIKRERDEARSALSDILEALEEARTGLDGCSDINNAGGPNWAMKLLQLADLYAEVPNETR